MVVPTPEPPTDPVTLGEALELGCQVANAVDPLLPDPALAGTNMGVSEAIDQAAINLNMNANASPAYVLVQGGVNLLQWFKNKISTGYNFVCQQVKQDGPYYDLFPLDNKISNFQNQWSTMTVPQKALAIGFVTVIVLVGVALLITPPQ